MSTQPRNNFLVKDFHMHKLYSLVRLKKKSDQIRPNVHISPSPKPWCRQLLRNYAILGSSWWKVSRSPPSFYKKKRRPHYSEPNSWWKTSPGSIYPIFRRIREPTYDISFQVRDNPLFHSYCLKFICN